MIKIYKRDFRKWLMNKGGKKVGVPDDSENCPLCRFLKSQGATKIDMQVTCRTVDGARCSNSMWQRDFQVEAMWMQRELKNRSLTGREALEALELAHE